MPAKKSANTDPWAAMDALMAAEPEPMGPEWFTLQDFAARYNLSRSGAQSALGRLMRDGKVDNWTGVTRATRRVTNKFKLKAA
jgi:hypothetical protein